MKTSEAFWDTSALVPLCCYQAVSAKARQVARVQRPQVVWWGTSIEGFNTFVRLLREGEFSQVEFDQVCRKFQLLRRSWVEISPSEQVRELAEQVLRQHALSAADGLQLAAALLWCDKQPHHRRFVCADKKLAEAAEKLGFDVVFLAS
jgi:predicted nucleic acid-binding protein